VTTKPAGTGLGLSIVKKLVAMHGGEVELRPREDAGGAVARFTLPEALSEPPIAR
jgi:two-component system osmolarity sensor histidine kinase EnvZ